MDETKVYNGAFTNGSDIDTALIRAMNPASAAASGSNELASSGAAYAAAANEIIKVTITGITGTGGLLQTHHQFIHLVEQIPCLIHCAERKIQLFAVMGSYKHPADLSAAP